MNRRGFLGFVASILPVAAVVGGTEKANAKPVVDPDAKYALTPNEIRALRNRKPYLKGGDDPLLVDGATVLQLDLTGIKLDWKNRLWTLEKELLGKKV